MNEQYRLEQHVIKLPQRPDAFIVEYLDGDWIHGTEQRSGKYARLNAIDGSYEYDTRRRRIVSPVGYYSPDHILTVQEAEELAEMGRQMYNNPIAKLQLLDPMKQRIIEKMASQQVSADELVKALNQLGLKPRVKVAFNFVAGWVNKESGELLHLSDILGPLS